MSTFCVGLTGGIASGKTFVARHFEDLGVPVLDADQVARAIVAPGEPALVEIARQFGSGYLLADGSLDRQRMREHVFSDPAALERLEQITHPAIHDRVAAWRAAQATPYCIYSTALLVEAHMAPFVDRILVVDVPEAVQLDRIVARDRHDVALARRILATQAPRTARLLVAHDILDNRAETHAIIPQIERLHALYQRLAARLRST